VCLGASEFISEAAEAKNKVVKGNNFETKMFPNPAKTSFSIVFDNSSFGQAAINIFDSTGRKVETLTRKPNQREVVVDTSSLENGLYIVTTTFNGNTQKARLMVAK